MENGGTIPGQEIGSGLQKPVNPDGFVTIDVESFSNVIHKDFSSSSPRITVSFSKIKTLLNNHQEHHNFYFLISLFLFSSLFYFFLLSFGYLILVRIMEETPISFNNYS
jgi:hypothetical protein|uniref:At4g21212 n=1 Tax=Arabidopsis thaliana TaxID=3702 RepID=Q945N8_ARATH|nr:At4g21212 [Arabidopsis thaliana]AAL62009.1 At4g21212/At4g21212 [Arabidopsis thaliana]